MGRQALQISPPASEMPELRPEVLVYKPHGSGLLKQRNMAHAHIASSPDQSALSTLQTPSGKEPKM